MRQVIERIAVALALLTFAAQQAVERAGQAQQFTRVLAAQAITRTRFHFVKLQAQPAQRTKPQVRPAHNSTISASRAAPKPK